MFDRITNPEKTRIVQELVPGKQITLAHIIANPDPILYRKLGLYSDADDAPMHGAIGVITMSPAEYAIIAADLALKASDATLGFVDRFSGTLLITGSLSAVQSSLDAAVRYAEEQLGFQCCPVTKT